MSKIKTATITFHAPDNSGAFLQAFALQQVLINELGYDNEIINFISDAQKKMYGILGSAKGRAGIGRDICALMHYKELKSKKNKFASMRRDFLLCSKEKSELGEVLKESLDYDVLICGSDQIWNTGLRDYSDAFYLPGIRNKISYAPSFGQYYTDSIKDKAKQYLSEFLHISVREQTAVDLVKDVVGFESELVLDPTFLLDPKNYELIYKDVEKPFDHYIFLYTVNFDVHILKQAKVLSDYYQMPVITVLGSVSAYAGRRAEKHGIKVLYSGGPSEFLAYLKYADYVLTNSFHGVAFSIIFEKEFYNGRPIVNGNLQQEYRIDSILDLLKMEDHIFSGYEYMPPAPTDWEQTRGILEENRNKSVRWLKKAIEDTATKYPLKQEVPVLFTDKRNCCGCGACFSICPTGSILMIPDEEGFLYPRINKHTCINCKKCSNACSFQINQTEKGFKI